MSRELVHNSHYKEDKSFFGKLKRGFKKGFQYVTGTYSTHANIESREKMFEENQKLQVLSAKYNRETSVKLQQANAALQKDLQDRHLRFQKLENKANRQTQLQVAALASETMRYEGEQNRFLQSELAQLQRQLIAAEGEKNRSLQRDLQTLNHAFQESQGQLNRTHAQKLLELQLEYQRHLQLELKEIEYEYAVMLANIRREQEWQNIEKKRQIDNMPLRMLLQDILGATDSSRKVQPLYIFFSPSKLQYDEKGRDMSKKIDIENLAGEYIRDIVSIYTENGRAVSVKGGAWKSKQDKSETAIQSIFNLFNSESMLILEANEEQQNYQINVGSWAANAAEARYQTFLSFSWKEILYECMYVNAPIRYAKIQKLAKYKNLEKIKGLKLEDIKKIQNNYDIFQTINELIAEGIKDEFEYDFFKFEETAKDIETLRSCLALYHSLTIALMIDQHFLLNMPPSLRQAPLLPQIFDKHIADAGVPSELVVKLWLPALVDAYKACYDYLSHETAAWAEELRVELIETLTYFKDKKYALEVLVETLEKENV